MSTQEIKSQVKVSPAVKVSADKLSGLRANAASHRDKIAAPSFVATPKPVIQVPLVNKLSMPVMASNEELSREKITKAIAGFYASHLRIDMKNFKRAETLFKKFRSLLVSESALKDCLGLLSKHLEAATAKRAEVTLRYASGRLCFSRKTPKHGSFSQVILFSGDDLTVFTKWDDHTQIELLRATLHAIDDRKEGLDFDAGLWNNYLAESFQLKQLDKALDVAERQRLRFGNLVAKINKKSLTKIFKATPIAKVQIKTDKRSASFIDLVNAKGQRLSLKVTRLVSAAILS